MIRGYLNPWVRNHGYSIADMEEPQIWRVDFNLYTIFQLLGLGL